MPGPKTPLSGPQYEEYRLSDDQLYHPENRFYEAKHIAEMTGITPRQVRTMRDKQRGPRWFPSGPVKERGGERYKYGEKEVLEFVETYKQLRLKYSILEWKYLVYKLPRVNPNPPDFLKGKPLSEEKKAERKLPKNLTINKGNKMAKPEELEIEVELKGLDGLVKLYQVQTHKMIRLDDLIILLLQDAVDLAEDGIVKGYIMERVKHLREFKEQKGELV